MRLPATPNEEDNMPDQRTRARALDSRGRPVPGLYLRDGRFIAGFNCPQTGRWRMVTLEADTLTEARRERDALLAGLRDGRTRAPSATTVDDLFRDYQDARNLSERTRAHERHLFDRHLGELADRRAQDVTAAELARLLRGMRDRYSPWTCVAVHRLARGAFALGVRRGVLTRSPADGLAPSEVPRQRNARPVHVLDADALARLVAAGTSERWRAALGLAGFAGLRLGELRALEWRDVDLDAGTIAVSRSLAPDGTSKTPKTDAGVRVVPILPALRRVLVEWRLRSPHTRPGDLVVCTAEGGPVQERNVRRALDDAKTAAGLAATVGRLSMHALRHSCLSALATGGLAATTLAEIAGHTDPSFTLRVYARDGRDPAELVADVLDRAAGAGFAR
jgi:integrase